MNRKKLVLVFLFSIILSSFLLGYQYALSSIPSSGPYYLDIPFGTANYYIGKFDNGSTYMVNGNTWQCTWNNPESSAVINAALGNLTSGRTWQEIVYLQNNLTIDSPIVIPYENYTVLDLGGSRITLADGSDCNMIEFYGGSNCDLRGIEIRNGRLDGNAGGQTIGDIIHIEATSWTDISRLRFYIHNLELTRPKVKAIHLDGGSWFWLHNISTKNIWTSGVTNYLGGSDSVVSDCHFSGTTEIYWSPYMNFDNTYFDGSVYINQSNMVKFDNCMSDAGGYNFTGSLTHSCGIHGGTIGRVHAGFGGIGIVLDGAKNCTIEGVTFREWGGKNFNKLIEETSGADFNLIYGNNFAGVQPIHRIITILGPNTQVYGNLGYVTEYWGTCILLNSTASIWTTHDCVGTPNYVLFGADNHQFFYYGGHVSAKNSTHIQFSTVQSVTAGDINIWFLAKYKP